MATIFILLKKYTNDWKKSNFIIRFIFPKDFCARILKWKKKLLVNKQKEQRVGVISGKYSNSMKRNFCNKRTENITNMEGKSLHSTSYLTLVSSGMFYTVEATYFLSVPIITVYDYHCSQKLCPHKIFLLLASFYFWVAILTIIHMIFINLFIE